MSLTAPNLRLYGRPCRVDSHQYSLPDCRWHGLVQTPERTLHLIEKPNGQLERMEMHYTVTFTDK